MQKEDSQKKLGWLIHNGRYLTFQYLKKKMGYRRLSYKKINKRQNDRKGQYSLFEKIAKK